MLNLPIDVTLEYRRIFGENQRPTLFAPNDVDYADLRRQIIDAPNIHFNRQKLPFEGLSLLLNPPLYKAKEVQSYDRMLKATKLFQILRALLSKASTS